MKKERKMKEREREKGEEDNWRKIEEGIFVNVSCNELESRQWYNNVIK